MPLTHIPEPVIPELATEIAVQVSEVISGEQHGFAQTKSLTTPFPVGRGHGGSTIAGLYQGFSFCIRVYFISFFRPAGWSQVTSEGQYEKSFWRSKR